MYIGQIIYAILSNDGGVSPLVYDGNTENTFRIFPIRVPISADQLPLIVFEGDDANPDITLQQNTGLVKQRVRIDCLSADYDDANTLGRLVYNAMNVPKGVYGNVQVAGIFYKNESENEETLPGMGESVQTYIKSLEYLICYYFPTPEQQSSPYSFGFSGGFQ